MAIHQTNTMKTNLLFLLFLFSALSVHADEWIRINQLGYLPQSIKVAVFMSEEGTDIQNFQIYEAKTDKLCVWFLLSNQLGNGAI